MIIRWLKFSGLSLVVSATLWIGTGEALADESAKSDTEKSSDTAKKEKKSKIKPYDEIITEDAETKIGLFRTHQIDDDLFYEIPMSALGIDMLWVTQIAETTAGNSYAGMLAGNRVVRWEKRGDRILLRDVRYSIRAETNDPIASAVKASNLAPIIKVFDVVAYGKDQAPVIKVTNLFTKEIPEFSAKRSLNAGNLDSDRSFIEIVKAFPENIEVKVLASFSPKSSGDKSDGGSRSSGISALVHHSMVKLPDSPMKPRRHDSRDGFFNVSFVDFANNPDHEAETVRFITRWRLEKQNPAEKLSEPIKPIVFYVGRGTPDKWKSYIKAGIEVWQPAFEKAGFKNAILGRYAPDPREDPDWDAEDARISTIRWLPSNIENAFGPHVHDLGQVKFWRQTSGCITTSRN